MSRRIDPVEAAPEIVEPAPPASAPEPLADPYVSQCMDWMRQFEHVQGSAAKGWSTLIETAAERAASAHGWERWWDVAGAFLREAVEETAKRQGEWFSAVAQFQLQAAKMLVDLGDPSSRAAAAASEEERTWLAQAWRDPAALWFAPWLAGAAFRPVQVS
ncbi:MAG: hypothetical protein ACTHL8_14485 [Burkholderiaceae bacterium]